MWHPYQYDPVLMVPAGQVVVQRTIRRVTMRGRSVPNLALSSTRARIEVAMNEFSTVTLIERPVKDAFDTLRTLLEEGAL